MFKGAPVFEHAVDVHAALMGKGRIAHIGAMFVHGQIGDLARQPGGGRHARHGPGGQGFLAHLQAQIGQQSAQVGVPAPLAVAVDGTLNHIRPGEHPLHAQGHGQARVVVAMHPHRTVHRPHHPAGGFPQLMGQRAAVGIAQHQDIRPAPARGRQTFHGVFRILPVAVVKMFGVKQHLEPGGL